MFARWLVVAAAPAAAPRWTRTLSISAAATAGELPRKPLTKKQLAQEQAKQQEVADEFAQCKTAREVEMIVLKDPTRVFDERNIGIGLVLLGKLSSKNSDAKNRLYQASKSMNFTPEALANVCLGVGLCRLAPKMPAHLLAQLFASRKRSNATALESAEQIANVLEALTLLKDGNVPVFQAVAKQIAEMKEPVTSGQDMARILEACANAGGLGEELSADFNAMCDKLVTRSILSRSSDDAGDFQPAHYASILNSLSKLKYFADQGQLVHRIMLDLLDERPDRAEFWLKRDLDASTLDAILRYCLVARKQGALMMEVPSAFLERCVSAMAERLAGTGFDAKYFFPITDSLRQLGCARAEQELLEGERAATYFMHMLAQLARARVASSTSYKQVDERAALCERFSRQLLQDDGKLLKALTPAHLISVLSSLELLQALNGSNAALLQAVREALLADNATRLQAFNAYQLSMLCRCFAAHATAAQSTDLVQHVCRELATQRERVLDATDFYLLLTTLVRLGLRDHQVCQLLSTAVTKDKALRRSFQQHQLEAVLEALQALGWKDEPLEAALQRELAKRQRALTWPKPE